MKPNPGHCPAEAAGKRVRVRLANGQLNVETGWAADGRHGCRLSITGHSHDIAAFAVIA